MEFLYASQSLSGILGLVEDSGQLTTVGVAIVKVRVTD